MAESLLRKDRLERSISLTCHGVVAWYLAINLLTETASLPCLLSSRGCIPKRFCPRVVLGSPAQRGKCPVKHLGDRELTGCFGRVNLAETTMSVRFILLSCGVCASRSNGVLPNRTWGLKINESLLPQCTSGVNRRVVCPSCKAQAWVAWSWFDLLLMLALSVREADLPSCFDWSHPHRFF